MNHLWVCDSSSLGAHFFKSPASIFSPRLSGENPDRNPSSSSPCRHMCRSMTPNSSRWPSRACAPSPGLCRRTLWTSAWRGCWRNRRRWTPRATLIPNPSTRPSKWPHRFTFSIFHQHPLGWIEWNKCICCQWICIVTSFNTFLDFAASPCLKNLSTLPTNMQSIPMTSGPRRRSVQVLFSWWFLIYFLFKCSLHLVQTGN